MCPSMNEGKNLSNFNEIFTFILCESKSVTEPKDFISTERTLHCKYFQCKIYRFSIRPTLYSLYSHCTFYIQLLPSSVK